MQKAHDSSYNDYWKNKPDLTTPILAEQLNRNEQSVDTIDDRVIVLDTTKANQTDLLQSVKTVLYADNTGTFTFTLWNGSTIVINTDIEKVAVNFDYDDDPTSAHYQNLIITLDDGTVKYVDLSALITQYEFTDTSTIDFTVGLDGSISAIVKDGSITEAKLEPNYLATIRIEVGKAETAAGAAEDSAEDSEAWAVGQRNGQDVPSTDETYHNNAKYYADQAAQGAGVLTFNGRRGDVTPADGDYSIDQISPSTGATEGQIPIVNSQGEFEMQDIPSSGHTIKNNSGTSMTQRENLQFVGVYTEDDSANDTTKVNIVREMTKAQMNALSADQKKGFIETTDEPDNTYGKVSASDVVLSNNKSIEQVIRNVNLSMAYGDSLSITDMDDCPPGLCSSNFTSHTPSGSAESLCVLSLSMNNDTDYDKQIAWSMASPNKIYTRQCYSGSWGTWAELIPMGQVRDILATPDSSGNIAFLNQTDGIPISVVVHNSDVYPSAPFSGNSGTAWFITVKDASGQPVTAQVYLSFIYMPL